MPACRPITLSTSYSAESSAPAGSASERPYKSNRRRRAPSSSSRRLITPSRATFAWSATASSRFTRSSWNATALKVPTAESNSLCSASSREDTVETRRSSFSVNHVEGVRGTACPAEAASVSTSPGSIKSRNSPAPGVTSVTQTTPRRAARIPLLAVGASPGSRNASIRGRYATSRTSIDETSVSHASICSASSELGISSSSSTGRRRSTVPGNPLAMSARVVSSSCRAVPGRRRPALARSMCCGTTSSTPFRRSTRNTSTAPDSMNQTNSGSLISTGRLPAEATAVPRSAAIRPSVLSRAVIRAAPRARGDGTRRSRPPAVRRGCPAVPPRPCQRR